MPSNERSAIREEDVRGLAPAKRSCGELTLFIGNYGYLQTGSPSIKVSNPITYDSPYRLRNAFNGALQ